MKDLENQLVELSTDQLNEIKLFIEEIIADRIKESDSALPDGTSQIEIVQGYIDQALINYEKHRRGTNYMAIVSFSPSAPGNLNRQFFSKGSGSFRQIPEELEVGNVIEVAYDYTSSGGNRHRNRDFYRVVKMTDEFIYIVECDKPAKQ